MTDADLDRWERAVLLPGAQEVVGEALLALIAEVRRLRALPRYPSAEELAAEDAEHARIAKTLPPPIMRRKPA